MTRTCAPGRVVVEKATIREASAPGPGSAAEAMLLGDPTPQAMRAELDELRGDKRSLALAQAWFCVGHRHLLEGRADAARQASERCRGLGVTACWEHVFAGSVAGAGAARTAGANDVAPLALRDGHAGAYLGGTVRTTKAGETDSRRPRIGRSLP